MLRVDSTPNRSILVYSGVIGPCRDEVGLASILSSAIADRLGNYNGEDFTRTRFNKMLWIPNFNFLISTILWRRLLPVTLPYAGFLAAYRWSIRDLNTTIEIERDTHALSLRCKAGYKESEALLFWDRSLEDLRQLVSQLELSKTNAAVSYLIHS